jgi:hypothetical protein
LGQSRETSRSSDARASDTKPQTLRAGLHEAVSKGHVSVLLLLVFRTKREPGIE